MRRASIGKFVRRKRENPVETEATCFDVNQVPSTHTVSREGGCDNRAAKKEIRSERIHQKQVISNVDLQTTGTAANQSLSRHGPRFEDDIRRPDEWAD